MNWASVFKQVASGAQSIAEIARQNGTTAQEILRQIELQSSRVGSNYVWAQKAKDAMAQQAQTSAAEAAAQAEREAARRAAEARAKQEAERRAMAEATKRAAAEKAKQRAAAEAASKAARGSRLGTAGRTAGRAGSLASRGGTALRWGSRGVRVFLGVAGTAVGIALALWTAYEIYQFVRSSSGGPQGTPTPCPPVVTEYRKCPWTPEGYTVEACGPGFCWDGGPQGSLACKQEQGVENSYRNYTTDLVCNDGYVADRDPCTGVILACVKQ